MGTKARRMRDILIFFAISIPSFFGLQRGMDILHASSEDSGAVMLAKYGHFFIAAEVVALLLPFVLGAVVAGVAASGWYRQPLSGIEILMRTRAALLLSCVFFGAIYVMSRVRELFSSYPSFSIALVLALIPMTVTLIYWAVFPFTVRFLVARRKADD